MLVIPSTMTMLSNFALSARLPALVTVVHARVTVVEIIDGSMSFARRADDGPIEVRFPYKNDVSYSVSFVQLSLNFFPCY